MKKLLLPIMILAFPMMLQAQSMSMRHMFRSYDPGKEVMRIHLPSILIGFASWFVEDAETKYMLKNIRSVYVMVSEDEEFSEYSNFPSEIAKRLKEKDFNEMLTVKSDDENVKILCRERGHKKKEFVIAVDGVEDVLLYIRTKVDLAELLKFSDFGIGDLGIGDLDIDIDLKEVEKGI
jgi:hypothetical protein